MAFTITVNGTERQVAADGGRSLLEVLRNDLGITGPKLGCGEGACGACTVLIGRRAVTSCMTPAAEAVGQRVTTVEGLAEDGVLHPVQQAWLETGAMQCGYCTPGWLTATAALLSRVTRPDDARIAAELDGHVCRCCTYPRILRAVRRAAELMEQPELLEPVPQPPAGPAHPPRPGAGAPPWDRAKDAASFFDQLPDGLVTVVADDARPAAPVPGQWGGPARGEEHSTWLHVGADGSVTAFTGKVEAGQGTRTALGLLVAEELAVPVASVRVVMGDTGVRRGRQRGRRAPGHRDDRRHVVEVVLLDRPDQASAGGGETPIVAVAPAIANAIFSACGTRLRSMPLAPSGKVA